VREARERVRAAVKNSGAGFPLQRITVNLAPADVKKGGSGFDLAIALGKMAASGQTKLPLTGETLLIGELALDGSLRPLSDILPMVMAARERRLSRVLLPKENAGEGTLVDGMKIVPLE
jgi:magnesium chelatase family protein